MKKILFVLPFIILAIALSGCKPAQKAENVSTSTAAYLGGEAGLEISFLANAPPKTVYDKPADGTENPFDISIKLENKGEYTIPAGKYKVTLSGIEPTAFKKTQPNFRDMTSTDELIKKRRSAGAEIPGTFTIVTVSQLAYQSPVSGQIGPFNLRASACYEYQSESSSNICVLKDLLGTTRQQGICKPTEKKNVENSGAPVGVENLEQSVTGKDNIAFTFAVKHKGGEKNLVFKNEDQSCKVGDMTRQNKVGVKVMLGETDITSSCSGITGGVATIYGEGGAQVRCTQTLASDRGDYVQPVKIVLTYDYMQYVDQEITVRQVGT